MGDEADRGDTEPSNGGPAAGGAAAPLGPESGAPPGATRRTVPVDIVVHIGPEPDCVASLCMGGLGPSPQHLARPNETIAAVDLSLELTAPAPWAQEYGWRIVCSESGRDCDLHEQTGTPPFRFTGGPLEPGMGMQHSFIARGPADHGVLALLSAEARLHGTLTIDAVPAPPPVLTPMPIEYHGNSPPCLPNVDPSCGVLFSSSLHHLPEEGTPYRLDARLEWVDVTAPELTLRLVCATPGDGQCPHLNHEARGASPLDVSWEVWAFPRDQRLLLQVEQLVEPDLVEVGTRVEYQIAGALWVQAAPRAAEGS